MSTSTEVKSMMRAIVGIDDLGSSQLCTVVSVSENTMTCEVTPISGGANFMDVRLMADADDTSKGVYFKPTIGSVVMITPQDDVTYFVSMTSEVDEVWIRGAENGGVVKVADLVGKLNNIEQDLNTLKAAFSSWIVSPADGGAALKTSAAAWYGQVLIPTTENDLQSTTVKHG